MKNTKIRAQYLYKLHVFSIIFFCFVSFTMGQTSSVSITEPGIDHTPDNSALLDVYSKKKGVLFPRMSFETMMNIEEPSDGLMVFVTDTDYKGYWFWNATDAKWINVRSSGSEGQDIASPKGTIIMYCGEINSSLFESNGKGIGDMAGWYICNGQNNTPDLQGRFVMSATYNSSDTKKQVTYRSTTAKSNLIISSAQMHPHSHEFQRPRGFIGKHTHNVVEIPHFHSVEVGRKRFGGGSKSIVRRKKKRFIALQTNIPTQTVDKYITVENAAEALTINYDGTYLGDTGEGKEIENRPPYFTMVYLIKL